MALKFITSITVDGKTCGPQAIEAGLAAMDGRFTNMEVAGAIGRAGWEVDDFWIRQEVANRLLQKVRRAGLAICPDRRHWTAIKGGVLPKVREIEANGLTKKDLGAITL